MHTYKYIHSNKLISIYYIADIKLDIYQQKMAILSLKLKQNQQLFYKA